MGRPFGANCNKLPYIYPTLGSINWLRVDTTLYVELYRNNFIKLPNIQNDTTCTLHIFSDSLKRNDILTWLFQTARFTTNTSQAQGLLRAEHIIKS